MLPFDRVHMCIGMHMIRIGTRNPIPELNLNSTATAEKERMNETRLDSDGRTHAGEGQAHLKQLSSKSH